MTAPSLQRSGTLQTPWLTEPVECKHNLITTSDGRLETKGIERGKSNRERKKRGEAKALGIGKPLLFQKDWRDSVLLTLAAVWMNLKNIREGKPDTKECLLHDSIYMKF